MFCSALNGLGELIGVVMFGTLAGKHVAVPPPAFGIRPRRKLGSFRSHLVDVTGLCIYFLVALVILRGTLL